MSDGATAIREWREHVTVTTGYISKDGLVEAEVGFNETVNEWAWYVAIYDDETHSAIVNHRGDLAVSKELAIEAASAWLTEQGL